MNKTPFFKQKKIKNFLKIALGVILSIITSRIATKDEQLNSGLKDIINAAGTVIIDVLTVDTTVQPDTVFYQNQAKIEADIYPSDTAYIFN